VANGKRAVLEIYLPIAEMTIDATWLIVLGLVTGFLSGLFGVGGAFLLTPMLLFMGVPASVAVASQTVQIVAASVSGLQAQWRRGAIDLRMGGVLIAGGFIGSTLGVQVFAWLKRSDNIDVVVALAYVVLLATMGVIMLVESGRVLLRRQSGEIPQRRLHEHYWIHGLPLKMRFPKSRLYISALVPFVVSVAVGIMSAIMGVGGGFIMIPAMIYLLGMPTIVVVGTSLVQVVFVAANVALLQSWQNHTVDIILAGLLIVGAMAGTPLGSRLASRLAGEQLRGLMALLLVAVALTLLIGLVVTPSNVFSLGDAGRAP
jgi:uncharacterized protein